MIEENAISAYADTLDDEYPDPEGNKFPLIDFVNDISAKVAGGELESAVEDIYHFDDSPFSLISYLMKANMVGSISAADPGRYRGTYPFAAHCGRCVFAATHRHYWSATCTAVSL